MNTDPSLPPQPPTQALLEVPQLAPPGAPVPAVMLVDNAGDELAATRHINACGGPTHGRAVIRPTPGARGLTTLGLDVLVAAGKPPAAAAGERVTALAWELAEAWLTGAAVSDLIVDRTHLVTGEQLLSSPPRPVRGYGCCGAPPSARTSCSPSPHCSRRPA
ncbi:hypothetical protein AB0J52_00905 [Spirillospora sp. NPDC049652]